MRRDILALVGAIIFIPSISSAQVVITEIMYDLPSGSDSGREWVELYNLGNAPVDLTKFKVFENGTNHKIAAVVGGNSLAPGAYAVVADNAANFRTDWPQFSGQVFDSAFSLSNSGESLAIYDASSTETGAVSYQSSSGGDGDGNSLNRAPGAGAFAPHTPSPGLPMSSSVVPPPAPKVVASTVSKTKSRASASPASGDPAPDTGAPDMPDAVVNTDQAASDVAVAATPGTPSIWWISAAALAALAAAAVVVSKYFKAKEWSIVEETAE